MSFTPKQLHLAFTLVTLIYLGFVALHPRFWARVSPLKNRDTHKLATVYGWFAVICIIGVLIDYVTREFPALIIPTLAVGSMAIGMFLSWSFRSGRKLNQRTVVGAVIVFAFAALAVVAILH